MSTNKKKAYDLDDLFDTIKTNVERKGKIINFKEHKEVEWLAYMKKKQETINKNQELEQEKEEERNQKDIYDQMQKKESIIIDRLNRLKYLEKDNVDFEIENNLNRPLRGYLLENVVPTITEALIDSCKVLPEDPVDFLAE